MSKKRKKAKFTSKDYDKVQTLLDVDLKIADICKITGWSNAVVYQTKHSKDYAEYRKVNEERLALHNHNKEVNRIEKGLVDGATVFPPPPVEPKYDPLSFSFNDDVLKTLMSIHSLLMEQTAIMREQMEMFNNVIEEGK